MTLLTSWGHDIRVHRQYYRLPKGTLQLAKISKVLLAVEQGKLSKFKGKNLDQINIDPQGKTSLDIFLYTHTLIFVIFCGFPG